MLSPTYLANPLSSEQGTEFFSIQEEDSAIIRYNKNSLNSIVRIYRNVGISVQKFSKIYEDYEIVQTLPTNYSTECEASLLKEKATQYGGVYITNGPSSQIQLQSWIPSLPILLLRTQRIDISKKLTFLRELATLPEINHVNVLRILKVFVGTNIKTNDKSHITFSLLMPFYEHNLKEYLAHSQNQSTTELKRILMDVLCGLEELHAKNYIHFILDWENIRINKKNEVVIGGLGVNLDLYKYCSKMTCSKKYNPPEAISYKTGRSIIAAQENPQQFTLEKTDFFTKSVDIFFFGVLLQRTLFEQNPQFFHNFEHLKPLIARCTSESIKDRPTIPELKGKLLLGDQNIPHGLPSPNHCDDLFFLAMKYDEGCDGIERNYLRARELFDRLGNSHNHYPSLFMLWVYNLWELGFAVCKKKCRKMMKKVGKNCYQFLKQKADNEGCKFSQYIIGIFNHYGMIPDQKKDLKAAWNYYSLAAAQNHAGSICCLGMLSEKENETKAFEYFKRAADMGDGGAKSVTAIFYFEGKQCEKSYEKAFQLFQSAANDQILFAIFHLGEMFQMGFGTEINIPKAIELYKFAASRGQTQSQSTLGDLYLGGVPEEGIPKDIDLAVAYFKLAAENGDKMGQASLANIYSETERNNTEKSVHFLRVLARKLKKKKHDLDDIYLALGYANVNHVLNSVEKSDKSYLIGKHYFELEKSQGSPDAAENYLRVLEEDGKADRNQRIFEEEF